MLAKKRNVKFLKACFRAKEKGNRQPSGMLEPEKVKLDFEHIYQIDRLGGSERSCEGDSESSLPCGDQGSKG